jgi:hypothetical protein
MIGEKAADLVKEDARRAQDALASQREDMAVQPS